MIARLKITLLAIIIATQLFAGVYGIDEIKPAQPLVAKISFDSVLAKAKEHSHELKIANIDTLIARTGIMGARSEYFPKLYFNIGTEYTKNYKDYKQSIVTSVGDSFINPYTRRVVVEYECAYISQPELASILIKFWDERCPRCMIIVESTRGRELLNKLMESKYKYQS